MNYSLASNRVSDSALERACYVTRFLLADNRDIRNAFYKRAGRVAVIGHDEDTLDIPEHEVPSYWTMKKLRGLGATVSHPVSSAGEENLLCFKNNDKYPNEDRLLHELAHGIHNLGAKYALNGWHLRLEKHFNTIKGSNLWKETHARSTVYEYFVSCFTLKHVYIDHFKDLILCAFQSLKSTSDLIIIFQKAKLSGNHCYFYARLIFSLDKRDK